MRLSTYQYTKMMFFVRLRFVPNQFGNGEPQVDVEKWTRFWSYSGSNFSNFFLEPTKKKLTTSAHISNMSIKGKTSPKLIENQLAIQSRLSEGYSIHHEVKVISHSFQIRC